MTIQLWILLLLIGWVCVIDSNAQTDNIIPAWLTSDELNRIESEQDEKDRIKVLQKIATARLMAARTSTASEYYEQAATEIMNYGSLVEYTFKFIQALPQKEKDKRDSCRKFEIALRRDLNKLDSLRYQLPEKYAATANDVYERLKKVRETALSVVFGAEFFRRSEYKPLKEIP